MRFLGGPFGGHLGAAVSALVDGQLAPEAAERAWDHVLGCPDCRAAVEHEVWLKRRLTSLDGGEPPAHLVEVLQHLCDTEPTGAEAAWGAVDDLERRARTRRMATIAAVGAGSVSVAVLGFATLGGPLPGTGSSGGGAAISGATPTSRTPAPAFPFRVDLGVAASVHGRLPAAPQRHRAP